MNLIERTSGPRPYHSRCGGDIEIVREPYEPADARCTGCGEWLPDEIAFAWGHEWAAVAFMAAACEELSEATCIVGPWWTVDRTRAGIVYRLT